MTNKNQFAFTLLELLITLAIIAILANIGVPSFTKLIQHNKVTAEVNQLNGMLQSARNTAITQHKLVTVCPTNNGQSCQKDWSLGYMVFIDNNGDRQYNQDEQLVSQHIIKDKNISLRWRAFGRRTSLQWHQTGITNHQNGSFEFCYKEEPELSRGLFITKAGRIRLSKDKDGDGIHENARDTNIKC